MALYDITRTCGHSEQVQIYGTNSHGERERRAKWETTKPCSECPQAARDQANTEAARAASESGLPDLTGSPKQIAWAQSIRLAGLADLEGYARRPRRHVSDAAHARMDEALYRILVRIAEAHAEAKWWIDNRGNIGAAAHDEMTDADRAEIAAASVEPQDLTDIADGGPATPQAAIAALRAAGWSAAKVAADCGVHRSTIYRWAAGTRVPSARSAAALVSLTEGIRK
jgi:DNA-binding transcriptional regulator YiaG